MLNTDSGGGGGQMQMGGREKHVDPYVVGTRIIAIPARASRTVEEMAKEKEIYMFNQLPKNVHSFCTDALLKCGDCGCSRLQANQDYRDWVTAGGGGGCCQAKRN